MKFEDVPKSVLRPALEAYAHASGIGILPDDEVGEDWDEDYLNGMQAAIAAAINAWPGAFRNDMEEAAGVRRRIILPLTEPGND